jgi:hypothetical protein
LLLLLFWWRVFEAVLSLFLLVLIPWAMAWETT